MAMKRVTQLLRTTLAMTLFAAATFAHAESDVDTFPNKAITIIAHTGPGSATDVYARQLARAAEPIFNVPVVVVNRPGGGGATQMAAVSQAKPDGYTLGVTTISHLTAMHNDLKGLYTIDDFSWVVMAEKESFLIAVPANSPHKDLKSLADAYKKDSGKTLTVGAFGSEGSAHNIAFNLFAQKADINFTWVPFEGGTQSVAALLGNHIEATNNSLGTLLPFYESGRINVLGIYSDERSDVLPDVPTYAEFGLDPDVDWIQVRGLLGPKDIPMEIQQKLADGFSKAMASDIYTDHLKKTNLTKADLGPEEFSEFVRKTNITVERVMSDLESGR